jgi:hypothetical protein
MPTNSQIRANSSDILLQHLHQVYKLLNQIIEPSSFGCLSHNEMNKLLYINHFHSRYYMYLQLLISIIEAIKRGGFNHDSVT